MNHVVLVGRLARDPELRHIPGTGTPIATFSIAIDRDYTKKDGTRDTDFIPVEVMGKPAEFVANYVSKGRLVAIQGSIRVDNYEKDGQKRSFTKVSARNVQALDSNKNKDNSNNINQSQAFNTTEFQTINDDDIPF